MALRGKDVPIHTMSDLEVEPAIDVKLKSPDFGVSLDFANAEWDNVKGYYRSDYFAIYLVTAGEVVANINLKQFLAKQDALVITGPSDLQKNLGPDSPDRFGRISGVAFNAKFLANSGIMKNAPDVLSYFTTQTSPVWHLDASDAKTVKGLLTELDHRESELDSHPFGQEILYAAFNIFLLEIAALNKRYAKLHSITFSRKESLVLNFVNLVKEQCVSHRSVQYYAAHLNVTPKYLTETVKEIMGESAGEVIVNFVILEARLLLDDPDLSVAAIADRLGFADQSMFGKFFKRYNGVSPKEYRKSHQR